MSVIEKFKDKRILIWGYGREGKSSEQFFKNLCDVKSIDIFEGKREEIDDNKYDFIVKSPGIVMEEDNDKFISQTEIFLTEFRDQTIGITGTKGKSTTSSLLYYCLDKCLDRNVILLGNIGLPCLDYFESITKDTVVVFEMSCHQLAHAKVSPHIAVFLNIFEEHLDYYHTFDKYLAAKQNIARYQTKDDFFFCGENVPAFDILSNKTVISFNDLKDYDLKLLGDHNKFNADFVFNIATKLFNLDADKVKEAMSEFTGLKHRLEHIGNLNGIDYYDDSISTIPQAAIQAIQSVKNAETILIGGLDRGIDYQPLIDFIEVNKNYQYIFMYESGKRIFDSLKNKDNCYIKADLYEAIDLAKEITKKGNACLLSPAAASYGYFKNFEERGDKFKEYVGL